MSAVVYHGASEYAGILDDTDGCEKILSASYYRSAVCGSIGKLYSVRSGVALDIQGSRQIYCLDRLFRGFVEKDSYFVTVGVGISVGIVRERFVCVELREKIRDIREIREV